MVYSDNAPIAFGEATFAPETGELWLRGERRRLTCQSARALELLLEHPGELITRDELRERLWDDGRVVCYDEGISTCIRQLRRSLGDDPKRPHYIETIPKRGYRWIAPVRDADEIPEVDEQQAMIQLGVRCAQMAMSGVIAAILVSSSLIGGLLRSGTAAVERSTERRRNAGDSTVRHEPRRR